MKIRIEPGRPALGTQHRAYVDAAIRRALHPMDREVESIDVHVDVDAGACTIIAKPVSARAVERARRRGTWVEALEDAANALAVALHSGVDEREDWTRTAA